MLPKYNYKPFNDFVYQKFAELACALQADSRQVKQGSEIIANNSDFVMHKLLEMQEHVIPSLIDNYKLDFLIHFLLQLDNERAYSRAVLKRASDLLNEILRIDRLAYLASYHRGHENKQSESDAFLIINLGSYVHADTRCLQTVPLYARELAHHKRVTIINVDYAFAPENFFAADAFQTKNLTVFKLAADIEQVSDLKFIVNQHIKNQHKVIIHSFTSAIRCPLHYRWVAELYNECLSKGLATPTIMAGYHDDYGVNALLLRVTDADASHLATHYSQQVASQAVTGTSNLNDLALSRQSTYRKNMRAAGWEILRGNAEHYLVPDLYRQLLTQCAIGGDQKPSTEINNSHSTNKRMR